MVLKPDKRHYRNNYLSAFGNEPGPIIGAGRHFICRKRLTAV